MRYAAHLSHASKYNDDFINVKNYNLKNKHQIVIIILTIYCWHILFRNLLQFKLHSSHPYIIILFEYTVGNAIMPFGFLINTTEPHLHLGLCFNTEPQAGSAPEHHYSRTQAFQLLFFAFALFCFFALDLWTANRIPNTLKLIGVRSGYRAVINDWVSAQRLIRGYPAKRALSG